LSPLKNKVRKIC